MGHLVNPIGFRLSNKKIMDPYIPLYTKNNFREASNNIFEVNIYLKQFFSKSIFKKAGFIFSHFRLYETIKDVSLIVYLYSPDLIISNKARFVRFIKRTLYKYPAWKYRNFYKSKADEEKQILPAFDFFTKHTIFRTHVVKEYLQIYTRLNRILLKKPDWFRNKKRYNLEKFSSFYTLQQKARWDNVRISAAIKMKKEIKKFLKTKNMFRLSKWFKQYILVPSREKLLKKAKTIANKIRVKHKKKKNAKSKKKVSKQLSKAAKAAKGQKLLSKQKKKVQQKKVRVKK